MPSYKGFHVTKAGNGSKILQEGLRLIPGGRNIFGRGYYLWQLRQDAESWAASSLYPEGADIIEFEWKLSGSQVAVYDGKLRGTLSPNALAKQLLNKGVEMLIIHNSYMTELSMPQAVGDAYVLLQDVNKHFLTMEEHILDGNNYEGSNEED